MRKKRTRRSRIAGEGSLYSNRAHGSNIRRCKAIHDPGKGGLRFPQFPHSKKRTPFFHHPNREGLPLGPA